MNEWQRRWLSRAADVLYTVMPHRTPDAERLAGARLVAHRGNTGLDDAARENTLDAFDDCLALGLFGVELDVQWTRDGVPVVFHDADTARLFGEADRSAIADTGFDELRRHFASIPALEAVVERFGGRLHLMIELKTDTYAARHLPELRRVLSGLQAQADYHLLCLEPEILSGLDGIAPGAGMAVAETNTREIAAAVFRLGLANLAGHYVLVNRALRRDLDARGIRYGVGMAPSSSVMRRELNLGSHWIFTNRGARLARALRACGGRHGRDRDRSATAGP